MTIKEEKEYQSPQMKVIMLLQENVVCVGSDVSTDTEPEEDVLP